MLLWPVEALSKNKTRSKQQAYDLWLFLNCHCKTQLEVTEMLWISKWCFSNTAFLQLCKYCMTIKLFMLLNLLHFQQMRLTPSYTFGKYGTKLGFWAIILHVYWPKSLQTHHGRLIKIAATRQSSFAPTHGLKQIDSCQKQRQSW